MLANREIIIKAYRRTINNNLDENDENAIISKRELPDLLRSIILYNKIAAMYADLEVG